MNKFLATTILSAFAFCSGSQAQLIVERLSQLKDTKDIRSATSNQVLALDITDGRWRPFTFPGGGDMLAANNLSEVVNAATARSNLGLVIGTDVQAYSADLAAVVGLAPSSFVITDGSGVPGSQSSIDASDLSSTTGTGTTVVLSASPTLTGTLTVPTIEASTLTLGSTGGSGSTLTINAATPSMSVDGGNTHEFLVDGGSFALSGMPVFFPTEATITTGAFSASRGYHTVDTESDAATDDLDTINFSYTYAGGSLRDGTILLLSAENSARTVVIKDGTGNIQTQGGTDITLDDLEDIAILVYDDTANQWYAAMLGSGGGGSFDIDTLSEGTESDVGTTDMFVFSDSGTEKKLSWENFIDLIEATSFTFSSINVTTLDADALVFNEKAAAASSTAGQGEVWVKNTTPNTLYFTDDAGTDHQLGVGGTDISLTDNDAIRAEADTDALADDTYQGFAVLTGRNAGETITQWDMVYLNDTDDEYHQADADESVAAGKAIGMAVAAGTDTNPLVVLVHGIVRNDGWNWSGAGISLYVSDTAGGLTETAPSTSGDVVKVVATTLGPDSILLHVTPHWIEVE